MRREFKRIYKALVSVACVLFLSAISGNLFAQVEQRAEVSDSIRVTREFTSEDFINPGSYILKDVKVHGVKYINSELIVNAAGLVRGERIDIPGDAISSAIRKLWSQRFYSDIQAYMTVEGDEIVLDLYMKERPRISKWVFNGIKESEEKSLREDLKLSRNSELSDYVIHGVENNIKSYFVEKGFINVNTEITQKFDTTARLENSFVILTFDIDKGEKMKIKEVIIEGNEALDAKKLKNSMKGTREKSLMNMFKTAKFNEKKFDEDKDLMIDYMQSKGYRNGHIVSDSLYIISDNRVGLKVNINEGEKYYYRDITFTGNTKYTTEQLREVLGITKGESYDKKHLESRLGIGMNSDPTSSAINISSIYNNNGYLTFNIDPVETVIAADSIDLDIRIAEGKPYTINDVRIIGNTRTTDRVIRRELTTRPGRLYSQDALMQSLRQIQSMGHFTDNINPVPIPVSDGLVDIELNLEEKPNDQLELSGGWGSGVFVASVGVTFNNVSMRKFTDKSAWKPYPTGDNQKLSLSIQTNGSYYKSFQASFQEPWLGGSRPNSFSVSAYYSEQSDGSYYYQQEGDGYFATTGVAVSYGKRLTWPDPNFTLMGSLGYKCYHMDNWDYFEITDGTSNIVTLSGQLARKSTDHFMFPRGGSEISLGLTVTPPYSLFRKSGYYTDEDLTDEKAYKWIEYYQVESKMKWFVSALQNRNLVFMFGAELGYLGHYTNQELATSIFEGYSLGGDGISGYSVYGINNIGLRGYDDDAITPYATSGDQSRLYNKFTFEVRYPIIMEASTSIYALAFAEAGNAFDGWTTYNPFSLKRSLGIGVRLYLPVVGMFGIDWGYGFDKAVSSDSSVSGSQFHFSIGQSF